MAIEQLDPNPASFIHSLRSVGYSLETAVADIIDNSITAEASNIKIFFKNDVEHPIFAIIDNGKGMSLPELRESMRLGTITPLAKRSVSDLGRFGLGMKTASFSICRRLTVLSKFSDNLIAARWDLDEIEKTNSWNLEFLTETDISELPFFSELEKSGTAIIWEKIDRIVDKTSKNILKEFEAKITTLEKHLQLTFHRYIEGEKGIRKINIYINEHQITPFDPFNVKNPATQELEKDEIPLGDGVISITPYILPHHSKTKEDEYDRYAGDGGYLSNQGFYVYRNKRLIMHGAWFRLATPENLTKLARVRIDIPNDMDLDWSIDVKKSTAIPPAIIRDRLKNTIDRIMGKSVKTYQARGRKLNDRGIIPVWLQKASEGKISYSINTDHPFISKVRNYLSDKGDAEFIALLELIAKCFPTDLLFNDYANKPKEVVQNEISKEHMFEVANMMISGWMKNDMLSLEDALEKLSVIEPFNKHMDYIKEKRGALK